MHTFEPTAHRSGKFNSILIVSVNGIFYTVRNGVMVAPFYFSSDGGTTPKDIDAIASGDTLYWDGADATPVFELAVTDRIDMHYEV